MTSHEPGAEGVGRVTCGDEVGTAFMVAPGLALTAAHVVFDAISDNAPISVDFGHIRLEFTVHGEPLDELDLVFLVTESTQQVPPLELECSYLSRGIPWSSVGFPVVRGRARSELYGIVESGTEKEAVWDSLLAVEGDGQFSLKGMSGAPVAVDGVVRAVITHQLGSGLGAVSLHRLRTALEELGANPTTRDTPSDLPPLLRSGLDQVIPNLQAEALLDEAIAEGGYILMEGESGSGKSVIAGQFEPELPEHRILGRYFAGPEQPLPFRHRLSPRGFLDWLASVGSRHSPDARAAPDGAPIETLAMLIARNLGALAEATEETGVLLLDGIDELAAAQLDTSFLDVLPRNLPSGLAIVLTVNSGAAFSDAFPDLAIQGTVAIPPLPQTACEAVVRRRCEDAPPGDVAALALASNGNPLILSYVVKTYSRTGDLEAATTGAGEGLDAYYRRVWSRTKADEAAFWMFAVLSRARGALSPEQLGKIVPESAASGVTDAVSRHRHLLRRTPNGVELYHLSLRRFLMDATRAVDSAARRRLATYCETNETPYGVKNRVYHLLVADGPPSRALAECTQQWLDGTVASGIEPEFPLGDIDRCVAVALQGGDYPASVRLLLLRSRAAFRYDYLLAKYASEMGQLALRLNGDAAAIGYVLRDELLLLSPGETSAFVRDALRLGRNDAAIHVFESFRRSLLSAWQSQGLSPMVLPPWVDLLCQSSRWAPGRFHRDLYQLLDTVEAAGDEDIVEALKSLQWADLLAATGSLIIPRRIVADRLRFAVHASRSFLVARDLNRYVAADERECDFSSLPDQFEAIPVADIGSRVEDALSGVEVPPEQLELFAAFFLATGSGRTSSVWEALPEPEPFLLRDTNGVDVRWEQLEGALFWERRAGFLGADGGAVAVGTEHAWEERLVRALRHSARLEGAWAAEAPEPSAAWASIEDILRLVDFPLGERVLWEAAYAVPEALLPEATARLARIVVRYVPSRTRDLVDSLVQPSRTQMGVYTEGYVDCLLQLGESLRVADPVSAAVVYTALWDHVRQCVFERDARVSALLDCAIGLHDVGETALSADVALEALQSANGPGWYKEDQYRLLVEALSAVQDQAFTERQWRDAARVLETASGEATFQRWVRKEKEHLISHLASIGLASEAVALVEWFNSPPLEEQVERIAREPVDQVAPGIGSRFGVAEVQEQQVAFDIARALSEASPQHRWTLVELFAPCGSERRTRELLQLGCELIASAPQGDLPARAARLMFTDFDVERRDELAVLLSSDACPLEALVAHAPAWEVEFAPPAPRSDAGVARGRTKVEDPSADRAAEQLFPGMVGPSSAKDALRECHRRNAPAAEVARALGAARAGGWDIRIHDPLFEWALRRLFEDGPGEGVRLMSAVIDQSSRSSADWRVAAQLVQYASPSASSRIREEVHRAVIQHVEVLLRPELHHLSQAALPPGAPAMGSADQVIECFLLSLLDHTDSVMRSRAASTLFWLLEHSDTLLGGLAARVENGNVGFGRELAAAILGSAAKRGAEVSKSRAAERTLAEWEDPDLLVHASLRGLGCPRRTRPNRCTAGAATITMTLSVDGLRPVVPGASVDELAREYCGAIAGSVDAELAQLLWKHRFSAEDEPVEPSGTPLERAAIGRSVADESDALLLERHALWNPDWPDLSIDLAHTPRANRVLEHLNAQDYFAAFTEGSELILHSLDVRRNEDGGRNQLEIAAVLMDSTHLLYPFSASAAVPYVDAFGPAADTPEAVPGVTSAVCRFRPLRRAGGALTPARVAPSLLKACSSNLKHERKVWRAGRLVRPVGVGEPAREGVVTTASRDQLRPFIPVLWWVVWYAEQAHAFHPHSGYAMRLRP